MHLIGVLFLTSVLSHFGDKQGLVRRIRNARRNSPAKNLFRNIDPYTLFRNQAYIPQGARSREPHISNMPDRQDLEVIVISDDDGEDEDVAVSRRPLLQLIASVQYSDTHTLDFQRLLDETLSMSTQLFQAQQRRHRHPQLSNNVPAEVKTARVTRSFDQASPGDVPPDTKCVTCFERRGKKRSPAWLTPCCGQFACDKCARQYARYPTGGLCSPCTRYVRKHGETRLPVGGAPTGCRCKYRCPCCNRDDMRSIQVEQELEREREREQAKSKHRRRKRKRQTS